jgi:predicted transcriptional regulator
MATLTLTINPKIEKQLADLASTTHSSPQTLALEAIQNFIDLADWQASAIKDGISAADSGCSVAHEHVESWVESWGADNEQDRPKCK